ncbi:MAG: GtrA family protein [Acutalibacteraceae bacterium]|nr:GtrA family protein [Acutalibacteraceae bacterium]
MNKEKFSKLFWEMFRFGIVGGISFIFDTVFVLLFNRVIFGQPQLHPDPFYTLISTAVGFAVGLTVNYLLSRFFVFVSDEQKKNGKGFKAFLLFAIISIIGLILTEVLVIGLCALGMVDFWAKVVAAAIVMIWNYVGRKVFIFK